MGKLIWGVRNSDAKNQDLPNGVAAKNSDKTPPLGGSAQNKKTKTYSRERGGRGCARSPAN